MSKYQIHGSDLAGFELCGYKKDEVYYMESGAVLDELPKELELLGNVYTLDDVIYHDQREPGLYFFNAIYGTV